MTTARTTLPVLFRKDRGRDPEITAVFPTEVGGHHTGDMVCYTRIGQHSSCSLKWYWTTRAAKPEEYANLLAELKDIYEKDPDEPVQLVVRQRITPQMRKDYERQLLARYRDL